MDSVHKNLIIFELCIFINIILRILMNFLRSSIIYSLNFDLKCGISSISCRFASKESLTLTKNGSLRKMYAKIWHHYIELVAETKLHWRHFQQVSVVLNTLTRAEIFNHFYHTRKDTEKKFEI